VLFESAPLSLPSISATAEQTNTCRNSTGQRNKEGSEECGVLFLAVKLGKMSDTVKAQFEVDSLGDIIIQRDRKF
jgi:hypothetical protein